MKSVFICVHLWFFQFFIFMNIARADDINTTHSFCQLLPNYKEAPGVEYQPGVDAHGQFVAPADITGQPALRNFDSVEIPVEANLVRQFGVDVPPGTQLKPDVALISIHKNGQVDYNGQDISKQAHELCDKNKSK